MTGPWDAMVAAHVHSEWSYDGHWTLERIARVFGLLGYDVVLMAEHDRGFDAGRWEDYRRACAAASSPDLLVVPGIEYGDGPDDVHVAMWGDLPFLGDGIDTGELLERGAGLDVKGVLAHPARRDVAQRFDPAWVPHLLGIELWNRKYDGYAPGPAATDMLRAHRGLVPFAGIDFHTPRQLCPLAMAMTIEGELTPQRVFHALAASQVRPRAVGMSALRFTRGRGRLVARGTEWTRRRMARWLR